VYIPSVIRNYKQIFNGKEIAKSIFRYVLCIVLAFLISAAYGLALRILTEFQKDAVYKIINSFSFQYSKSSGIFGALIMAPFVEEMAFRGLMFGKFKNFIPVWAAAIFSALLFGIWHQNLPQFCGTVPMGLVIAFLYHQTGRLRYAMICHSVSNLFIGLAIANESSFLPVIPFFKTIFENIFALPIYVCIILIALVTISVFFILWRMLNFNSDKE
jgi:membrane protease YdiL (CAAX protease family)